MPRCLGIYYAKKPVNKDYKAVREAAVRDDLIAVARKDGRGLLVHLSPFDPLIANGGSHSALLQLGTCCELAARRSTMVHTQTETWK